ncbi:MAG TPA: DEAD/DEAH box helicase [Lichenihabitans sp.]|jgi:hypothetical protein|nr:DEAD/DEAH box helicase [Lichenihabitans sp.]
MPLGWDTSDVDEIELRRWRGRTEILSVAALELERGHFGTFRTTSASGGGYSVEIRDLGGPANSCGCIDHRVNGLGTCKHIEGVLATLRRRGVRAFKAAQAAGSPRIEIFLDRHGGARPTLRDPAGEAPGRVAARRWLAPFLEVDGSLSSTPEAISSLIAAWRDAPAELRADIRISQGFDPWLEREGRARRRERDRATFEAEVAAGRETLDILKHPLLPYQQAGVLHLAFGERALLADDMGLGKTIQAIGACELVARRNGVARVLVVCPASLKGEWEEQIARFSDRTSRLVFGPRPQRLAAYGAPAFFTIVNYEQVLSDAAEINATLKPDVVVLDEAQRIKNWQIKTARRVKSLAARHAFVLTGTPIENRIDELYSIVGYLDPELLGSLFRFNRDFYDLDERGRPVGFKNLGELKARIAPVMLRRRKSDVEKDLPGRTVKTFFVPMAEEQQVRYDDYARTAAMLSARARKRPLTKKEFDQLQSSLACMRMICDTPAILDPTCRVSPKLEELEPILADLLQEPDRKAIVFSEWERMLGLVRELAGEMGIEAAWHTGSLPQDRRRAEIARFKRDPACRLFLSTDSGSVGLNLQVASAVINVDLPWNPAKLEQRIARAWRKNQLRSVTVVNLVTQDSIEHNILHLIGAKQALADGIVDGIGDLSSIALPSGRAAFMARMEAMLAPPRAAPAPRPPEEAFTTDLVARHGDAVSVVEARPGVGGRLQILAVLDREPDAVAAEAARAAAVPDLAVTILDQRSWAAMQGLAASGILRFGSEARVLYRAGSTSDAGDDAASVEDDRTLCFAAEARRGIAMARLMIAGGFPEEVPAILSKSLAKAAGSNDAMRTASSREMAVAADAEIRRLVDRRIWPPDALRLGDALGRDPGEAENPAGEVLVDQLEGLVGLLRPRPSSARAA